ncbi:hypothetical protein KAU43_02495 [candidate division WOR-3 bacterium]|nr:hypothetical protein [candidate division WOR-3 bacterium]
MMNNRKGIALITTLWIVVLMTLFASVYVLVSNMDIFTSMIMNSQKRALLNAETGKNYFFSLIPGYVYTGDSTRTLATTSDSFKINPAPPDITPYSKSGAWGMSYWVYALNSTGIFSAGNKRYIDSLDVGASLMIPAAAATKMIGNTMY